MSGLTVPVLTVVTGEGGSGGALALAVANRVLMLENAVYSVLSPEGFASILWKDSARSADAAKLMHLTAHDLYQGGVVEEVLPEPPGGAQTDWEATFRTVDAALWRELGPLLKLSGQNWRRAVIAGSEVGTGKKGATMSAPEILSTGSCVPTQVVTNEMLAQRVDTSDEWVFSRTGIHSRRHCSGGENGVAMAAQAASSGIGTCRCETGRGGCVPGGYVHARFCQSLHGLPAPAGAGTAGRYHMF